MIVPVWHPTGIAPPPGGFFPDPLEGGADVSMILPRWCAMRHQEPALSGPWSGSAYWTQTSESVLPRASLVRSCFPGPAKRRLGLKDCGPRVHPFLTTLTRSSTHDALVKNIYAFQKNKKGEQRVWDSFGRWRIERNPPAPDRTKWKNGEAGLVL